MKKILLTLLVVFFAAGMLQAQQSQTTSAAAGPRADWKQNLDDVQKKIVSLAEAMPAEKYSWRPAEGVRSVSEVYVHIAGGNYFLPTFAGINPPPDFARDAEKTVTDKAKVIELINRSFEHVRSALDKTSDADMNKKVNFFGEEMTVRGIFLAVLTHLHEHLGQSIAYARMNGVVPPWSAAENAAPSKK